MIAMNLVTPKAAAKLELLFNKPALKFRQIYLNLVTPKAAAQLEPLFNELASLACQYSGTQ
jgi:hypothetical protein